MSTWCVLGGGGSFGVHLALDLCARSDVDRVIGIGRNPLRPEPFTLGVARREKFTYRAFHVGNETDLLLEFLDEVRPAVIVNFAAQGEGAVSWRHSWRFFDTNATALVRFVEELSIRPWLKRFVQVGTSELYGSTDEPAAEDAPLRPTSPYAVSKMAFDLYLTALHAHTGFPVNIVRPSNAYGPGQLLHRVVPKAIVFGLTGRRLPLQGGGLAEKSYIHSADLARALYAVGSFAALGRTYNVGPERPISIRVLVERCAAALGVSFEQLCEMAPARKSEDSRYWLDSSAIHRDLGWEPTIALDAGLLGMVEWGRRYLSQLRDWPTGYEFRA